MRVQCKILDVIQANALGQNTDGLKPRKRV